MSESEDASFKEFVKTKIAERDAVIAERDAEIERLKRDIAELKKKKGISSAREGLTFDSHTGIWSDSSGNHFCPTCLNDEKRNPLMTEQQGWRCTAAGHYFHNPDAPPPRVIRRGGGGPRGWMA